MTAMAASRFLLPDGRVQRPVGDLGRHGALDPVRVALVELQQRARDKARDGLGPVEREHLAQALRLAETGLYPHVSLPVYEG